MMLVIGLEVEVEFEMCYVVFCVGWMFENVENDILDEDFGKNCIYCIFRNYGYFDVLVKVKGF